MINFHPLPHPPPQKNTTAVSGTFALEYAPQIARDNGPYVIDNSSAFRYDDAIPLVVPEINASAIKPGDRLIANPNCTTAIAVMALYPLHQRYGIRRIVCSTYQVIKLVWAPCCMLSWWTGDGRASWEHDTATTGY